MLEWHRGNTAIRLSPLFPAVLVAVLTLDTTGAVTGGLIAAVIHELGHLIAMTALGCPPRRLCIDWYGLRLETPPGMTGYGQGAVIALAGPLANLCCAGWLYTVSGHGISYFLHLVTALFHLLPARPLDGGQALRCLLLRHISLSQCDRLCRVLTAIILSGMTAAGIALWIVTRHNFTLLALAGYLIFCSLRCTE